MFPFGSSWLLLNMVFPFFFGCHPVSGTRRAELVKSVNQDCTLLSEDSESPTSSLVSLAPSVDKLSLSAELSAHAAFCAFFSLYNSHDVLQRLLMPSHAGLHKNLVIFHNTLSKPPISDNTASIYFIPFFAHTTIPQKRMRAAFPSVLGMPPSKYN